MLNRQANPQSQDALFLTLPPDMLRLIFSYLSPRDIAAVALVCREFRKRALQTPTETCMTIITPDADDSGKAIRRLQKVKVAGTYGVLRAIQEDRHPKEKRRKKLNNSCFVNTDMQDGSCVVLGGFINLTSSVLATLGVYAGVSSAGCATAVTISSTVSSCGLFTLFGCAVTEGVRRLNKNLRDERDQLNNDLGQSDYEKVRVLAMSDGEDEGVEYVENDSQPLLPQHDGQMFMYMPPHI